MQVLSEIPDVSWWSSPNVCPTSWQTTCSFSAELLYCGIEKYVSLNLTVPCTMWVVPLCSQMLASPSQPFWPYFPSQISSRPLVGRQRFELWPATIVVSSTLDADQSVDV